MEVKNLKRHAEKALFLDLENTCRVFPLRTIRICTKKCPLKLRGMDMKYMTWWLVFLALAFTACNGADQGDTSADDDQNTVDDDNDDQSDDDAQADDDNDTTPDQQWWRSAVFMEIYVRSYQDSDGDGIGDLPGLASRLPYLAELGIGGLWLMPIFPSPFFDSGYDVADYEDINPDYGTLDDFTSLLNDAHGLDLKVFIDGVFNHTSSQHPWFLESRSSRSNPKRDWYVWADEPLYECPSFGVEFGNENWRYDEDSGQYYFHSFGPEQPDLNFDNPEVREALKDVVRFWFDFGVDGFRLDAATTYYQDADYCEHHPKTHAFLKELRAIADEYEARAFVGEVSGTPRQWLDYFGNGQDELHMALNFNLDTGFYMSFYLRRSFPVVWFLNSTYGQLPPGAQQAVFISNHDFYRYFDMLFRDDEHCKLAAALELTLPGTVFLYYGEEVGMADGPQAYIDYRDKARTPMHWDASANAGFTTGEPWIALAPNFPTHNVAVENADPDSLLNHFRRLILLRNGKVALNSGGYQEVPADSKSALTFFRMTADQSVLVALNFSDQAVTFQADLTSTPWAGRAGSVFDLYSGNEAAALSSSNEGQYPISLDGFSCALLELSN